MTLLVIKHRCFVNLSKLFSAKIKKTMNWVGSPNVIYEKSFNLGEKVVSREGHKIGSMIGDNIDHVKQDVVTHQYGDNDIDDECSFEDDLCLL